MVFFEEIDLSLHWDEMNSLMDVNGWPFTKDDIALSISQETSFGFVVKRDLELVAFFLGHAFGKIGYLSMIIIDDKERGKSKVFLECWSRIKSNMNELGLESVVAHCTKMSKPLLRYCGFIDSGDFNYLIRDRLTKFGIPADEKSQLRIKPLGYDYLSELVALDRKIFGMSRPAWFAGLLKQESTQIFGAFDGENLVSSVTTRIRKNGVVCLDLINAIDEKFMVSTVSDVAALFCDKDLECFPKKGSDLESVIFGMGFYVPESFVEKGPLVELRRGLPSEVGQGALIKTMSWL